MTRAWKNIFVGDFAGAFSMHPLFWMPPILLLPPFQKKWIMGLMIGLLLGVYILRMATIFPDAEPMVYNYDSLLGGFIR